MLPPGSLRESVLALREAASAILPIRGLGIVRFERDDAVMAYSDALGLMGYRVPALQLPQALRARAPGLVRLGRADWEGNRGGLLETMMLLEGLPDAERERLRVGQLLALSVPGIPSPTLLMLAAVGSERPTAAELEGIESVARSAARVLLQPEPTDAELARLRRLRALESLLPALLNVLDVREVFTRVSELTRDVLPHDVLALGMFSPDLRHVTAYAHTAPGALPARIEIPYPPVLTRSWLYLIVDDLLAHPLEGSVPLTAAGGRSSLRMAIRLGDTLLGGLNFTSFTAACYTTADLAIGRRIADHVALALAHNRLAGEVRRSEEMRARVATGELLDELLATIADSGELRGVFERVSGIARKVLPHDALTLAAALPDGSRVRVYGSSGIDLPEVVEIPPQVLRKVGIESEIVDDLQADPVQRELISGKLGFRSALRIAIPVAGKLDSALQFLSHTPGLYKPPDLALGRRIADRLALALSRERRLEASQRADEALARAARLEARVAALTEELSQRAGSRRVIGDAPSWRQVLRQATQVAATESTVLLLGESGTGKEVVARFVHGGSARREGPFVALNCAALPEQLLEAELFGYERGAFTGAVQSKPGQLEQASGGTLFLDEVGEMSLAAQAKFLRVLQEREFQRLGGTRVLKAEVRVVAATNRDLLKALERGQFREDLYYRLNVFSIQLPPLRERKDDVLRLSEVFLEELSRMLGRPPGGISKEARQALLEYDWPGNVRELRNVLERAAILADGGLIAAEHMPIGFQPGLAPSGARPASASSTADRPLRAGPSSPRDASPAAGTKPPPDARSGLNLEQMERAMIEEALAKAGNNKSKAARLLGLTRAQLYGRLEKHGFPKDG